MKALILATAAVVGFAAPSLAGGPTLIADDPIIAAAPTPLVAVHDWSGPYVGLSYGRTSGDMTYSNIAAVYQFENGNTPSIYAGYLWQRGYLVYGGELAYSRGNDATVVGFPSENLEGMIDLKGRVGYAMNRGLVYGVLGFTQVDYFEGSEGSQDTSGLAYGLGVDFAVTGKVSVGLEYLARKTDGDTTNPGQTRDLDLDTMSLRIGFSF